MADFDKFSSDYENILDKKAKIFGGSTEYFAGYKAKYVKDYLGAGFKGRILDYGCGVGLVVRQLKKHFDKSDVEITGYDISSGAVKAAARHIPDVMFTDDLTKVGRKPFDAVIIANVLHHVDAEERVTFLKDVAGLVKKNGYIFIFEHNPYNPLTKLIVKLCVFDKEATLLKLRDVAELMRKADIDIFEKRYIVFFPQALGALRFLEPMLGRVAMGTQYLCVGKSQGA
ncbi:MAG: class I SAM-dependent methyltransferase [Candidatus Omnitrophota bacterium]